MPLPLHALMQSETACEIRTQRRGEFRGPRLTFSSGDAFYTAPVSSAVFDSVR
jgi:hypothetical protein